MEEAANGSALDIVFSDGFMLECLVFVASCKILVWEKSLSGTTDFQVRPCGIRRTRKSVVLFNQQSGKRGLAKIAPRLPASGCESSLHCLQPNVTSCESLTDIQTELGS